MAEVIDDEMHLQTPHLSRFVQQNSSITDQHIDSADLRLCSIRAGNDRIEIR